MAKYDPISQFLIQASPPVMITFAALDALVDGLPPSAREHPSWWGNTVNESHVHANAWVSIGWLARADLQHETVRFERGVVQTGSGGGGSRSRSRSVLCKASSIWVPPNAECDYCGELHMATPDGD